MVKEKKLKYSKAKLDAYLSLNKIAQDFIKDTGGFTSPQTGGSLNGRESLEFLVTKDVYKNLIEVNIRYAGYFMGIFQLKNSQVRGYRYLQEKQTNSKDFSNLLDTSKLSRAVSELLNYKLSEDVTLFRVLVDSYKLGYEKYSTNKACIEYGDTDYYPNGRQNE